MPTSMDVNEKLVVLDDTEKANTRPFQSIVGGLKYLCHIIPNITFSTSVVSTFMQNPFVHHLGDARQILKYVVGTVDFGILYSKVSNFRLFGFSDSDWARCLYDRKSNIL